MEVELQGLLALAAIATAGQAHAQDGPVPLQPAPEAMLAALPEEPNEALVELQALDDIAAAHQSHRYARRSWQLMAHARESKERKLAKTRLDTTNAQLEKANLQIQAVSEHFPSIARALGLALAKRALSMTQAHAVICMRLAISVKRATADVISTACRASHLLASFIIDRQTRNVVDTCMGSALSLVHFPHGHSTALVLKPHAKVDKYVIGSYAHDWDETEQRMKVLYFYTTKGFKTPLGQVNSQTMMQGGMLWRWEKAPQSEEVVRKDPNFVRAHFLQGTTNGFLMAGVKKGMPFNLWDKEQMLTILAACDAFLLPFGCDRAPANLVLVSKIFNQCSGLPATLLQHLEPCGAHGIALVKGRPGAFKQITSVLYSFTKLMKQGRNLSDMQRLVATECKIRLRVIREPVPDAVKQQRSHLLEFLSGGLSLDYLYKVDASGNRTDKQYLLDLKSFVSAVAFDSGGNIIPTHYCYVEEQSNLIAFGFRVGCPCCRDDTEIEEKTCVPIVNWVSARCWNVIAESRWVNVDATCTRMLPVIDLIVQGLNDMRTRWHVEDDMVKALELIVKSNREDESSRNKLRLLRVCSGLAGSNVKYIMGVGLTANKSLNDLLWAILGHNKKRITLFDVALPRISPLAEADDKLVALLIDFKPDSAGWTLFSCMAVDFADVDVRFCARRHLLQSIVGLLDYFELRMSKPPYSWFILGDCQATEAEKQKALNDIKSWPKMCLPLLCQRLLKLCPDEQRMRGIGGILLKKLGESAPTAIDARERAHATMRTDMHSLGQAPCATASANRVLCREALTEHINRGGNDVTGKVALTDVILPLPAVATAPVPKQACNVWIQVHNSKTAAFKKLHAPHRPLTKAERKVIKEKTAAEYIRIKADATEIELWRAKGRADLANRQAQAAVSATPAIAAAPWSGLWASSCNRSHLCAPQDFMDHVSSLPSARLREPLVWEDKSLQITEAVAVEEDCAAGSGKCRPCGCMDMKKMCREHGLVPSELQGRVDRLVGMLNAYVKHAGKEVARGCNEVIWIRAVLPDEVYRLNNFVDPPHGVIVLLTDSRFRPDMQYWTRIELDGDVEYFANLPDEYPFTCHIQLAPCRMNALKRTVRIQITDELSLDLCKRHLYGWELYPLPSLPACGVPHLLDIEVLGQGGAFEHSGQKREPQAARRRHLDDIGFLGLGDPFQPVAGQRGAASASRHSVADEPQDNILGAEDFDLQDVPEDVVEDIRDCLEGARDHSDEDDSPEQDEQGSDADAVEISADDIAELEPGADAEPSGDAAGPWDDLIRATTVSGMGYVRCALPPFNAKPYIGLFATFPKTLPEEQRSVSCRCYAHKACSVVASRWQISNAQVFQWLFQAEMPANASDHDAFKKKHQELWKQMRTSA